MYTLDNRVLVVAIGIRSKEHSFSSLYAPAVHDSVDDRAHVWHRPDLRDGILVKVSECGIKIDEIASYLQWMIRSKFFVAIAGGKQI